MKSLEEIRKTPGLRGATLGADGGHARLTSASRRRNPSPECKEPAYYDDKCCFCGQVFEQDEAVKEFNRPTQIEKDGYTVVQASNCHVHIYGPDGRLVSHASCTSKMTEAELEKHLELVLSFKRRGKK